ncbi:conserved hypothetical protein [Sulfolobus islandicus REY15A]|uniref:Uncharacterized protein n=1 Tax=Saccharolobus islandicus (strain REY15A) TaxID=930945 RepID=F0NHA2_SACI5|nr:conserved hypothetical protein [Sulfolobus islandicus REY15A]
MQIDYTYRKAIEISRDNKVVFSWIGCWIGCWLGKK